MKMTAQEEIRNLRKVPLFQNLKLSELRMLSLVMKNVIFEVGELILKEGDEGDEAYIIHSGRVKVYREAAAGNVVPLNELGSGEMFGEMALFGDGFRTASVKAIEETLVGVMTKETWVEILLEFPEIAVEMLKVQTQRFLRSENRWIELMNHQT